MSLKPHLAFSSDGYLCGRPVRTAGGRNVSPGSLGRLILEGDLKTGDIDKYCQICLTSLSENRRKKEP